MNKKPLYLKQIISFVKKQSLLVKQIELINLLNAEDKILAENIYSKINLPPFKTKLFGSNNVGKNKIDIIIIPEKKIIENIIFFNIILKCYIRSEIFCLLLKI